MLLTLVITGNDETRINQLKVILHDKFHMKDLGVLQYFFGVQVDQNRDSLALIQSKYG